MKRIVKFVVVPFRQVKGRTIQGDARYLNSEKAAVELAERMSAHWAGVAAIEMILDTETGELDSPRELACYGIARQVMDEALAA